MSADRLHTLPKEERLSSKTAVGNLLGKGRWGSCGDLRYCWLRPNGLEINRIVVSVPKKFFKRAVRRNLLKRRMREAYRLQKELLPAGGNDIMFVYSSPEVLPFGEIRARVADILAEVSLKSERQ